MPRTPLPLPLGSYLSEVLPLSAQRVINWIPVVSESQALNTNILLQRNGLSTFASTSGIGRGQHVMADVEFSVTDRGMSLTPEDELHIWDFGWRGDRAKELHVNGSGIGLFTVKKIVTAHGGSVSVRVAGKYNEIITFQIRIPKEHILKKCPPVRWQTHSTG